MKLKLTAIPFFVLTFFLLTQKVSAQGVTTSAINGTIQDSNNEPLPGANIIVIHETSGTQYGTTSREDGKFNFPALRAGGPYSIKVSYIGYKPQESIIQELQLGQNLRIDFTLVPEAVELSAVTVTSEKNAILSSGRTGAGQNITSKDIQQIPTVSRNFQDFAKLSPQISGNSSSVASRNNRYNNLQIDGTQYNDIFGLGSTGAPGGQTNSNPISVDAIQEFQVVVAPYDVKYGGFTGGGLNAITRSGTNNWSGSFYGYGRNQSLVGDGGFIDSPADPKYPDFKEYQYGLRLGGPIINDKLFFFINGEITARDQPLNNISLSTGPATTSSLGDQFSQILKSKGFDPGSYNSFTVKQPSSKFFIRFDYNLSENHKLTLRHNYVGSYKDILDNRNSNNFLAFNTLSYRIRNITNSTVLQLNSTFSSEFSNELIAGFTAIRDRRAGISDQRPEVRVTQEAVTLVAGPDRFSSANELDQDIFELTDNFSTYLGNHVLTIGTHNEFFSFRNLFIRSFYGYYEFPTLADLQNNAPSFYQRVFSRVPGEDKPAAEFSVNQLGFYAQDEWTIIPNVKIDLGVRVDIPFLPTEPAKNDSVTKYAGYNTREVPSGNVMYSPRLGFNWDVEGNRTTQVRGGVGIFTGRIPYVWMSNNYGNTGTLIAEVNQASGQSVGFSIDPFNQPGVGDPGTGAPNFRSEIDLVDKDFKWPQLLRFNAAVDRQLPWNMIGTLEFIYSKSINDLVYEKINLNPSTARIPDDGRPRYGGTNSGNNNFFDVLLLKNTDEGYQYNFTAQLQRIVAEGFSFNTAYTYGVAKDLNSVLSSQAQSQIRFNPISINPNDPPLTTSSFDLGHRYFASVSYTHEFFANAPTTISLFYNIQSGRPFSFTVNGDLNNDGLNGNDLFYIPANASEILLGTVSNNAYVPASAQSYADLFAFIDNNDYLSSHKGRMSERNAARNPANDDLDFRIAQNIPLAGYGEFQVTLDILNVLNLINNDWGWYQTTPQDTYTIVSLRGTDPATNRPVYSFAKPANNTPWSPSDLFSRWQMQLGIRYSF
ncbi:MAG TPA: carboxypeptidase regulatory-like domain-containing protein [Ignavibacteriaceae bacterium]|nr:carboxypeptidase regulatory-like domain-containing protein [Ignavibacteriaceae bacterium]